MCANCPISTSREMSTGELEEAASLATTAASMGGSTGAICRQQAAGHGHNVITAPGKQG